MNYDTVIFDLDGTLLYTLEDLTISTNYALEPFTDVRRSLDEVRSFVGNGVRTLMIRALPGGEQNPDFEAAFARFRAHYAVHCRDHTRPYPGIMEAVRALAERGLKLGIVSNKPDPEVKDMNRVYFKGLFGAALGEREGVRRKPAPDSLLEAMRELEADKNSTLYVGDSEVDIATAANADVPCLSVTWGFRTREHLASSGASRFITSPEELSSVLEA
ncbi:HAD family hydrolase [uncultured Mailhella sp.]|uniref:HAD family hydrolase n=1 Tax=uncultured Mailhella sp. TaxID=1981031 RepID=UPI0025F40E32|nr:HAD-IA family hydrolase [uncultured Mailhella sp.]